MHETRTGHPLIAGLLLAAVLALPVNAATLHDRYDKTWKVGAGAQLSLSNENGSVEIESWDRDEVRVLAEITLKAGSSETARKAMERFEIISSKQGDRISVSSRKPRGQDGFLAWLSGNHVEVDVNYQIKVPRRIDLDIETVNGSIQAASLSGTLTFDSVNGRITVRDSRGAVSADTVNGSISAELLEIDAGESMAFGTTNGGITLSLPAQAKADVDAATTNGSISSELPLTSESAGRSRIRGTLNGGGAPIRMRTVNGSIRIAASS